MNDYNNNKRKKSAYMKPLKMQLNQRIYLNEAEKPFPGLVNSIWRSKMTIAKNRKGKAQIPQNLKRKIQL